MVYAVFIFGNISFLTLTLTQLPGRCLGHFHRLGYFLRCDIQLSTHGELDCMSIRLLLSALSARLSLQELHMKGKSDLAW